MPPKAEDLTGLALGRARAHYGRVYHVVEITRVTKTLEPGPDGEERTTYRERPGRALCGIVPQQWERPAIHEVPDSRLHRRCRELLAVKSAAEVGRVDHVIR